MTKQKVMEVNSLMYRQIVNYFATRLLGLGKQLKSQERF